ncbi:MAG: NosD domain-containing protein [Candidatus Bathyarchaeia archaeon]
MKRNAMATMLLSLLLFSLLSLTFNIHLAKTEPVTIIVPDNYPTIQEAINAANTGDTILVLEGTYIENVIVNKTVTLIGENLQNTIIDGNATRTVIQVTADNVSISGFTIKNSKYAWPEGGLLMTNVSNCNVSNIIITNNWVGLWLEDSSNNDMSNIKIMNNRYASWLVRSHHNTLKNTAIANNTKYGLWLEDSLSNNLSKIIITNNEVGIQLEEAYNNTIYCNALINNTYQVFNLWSTNTWDNGYPGGGNYWSDYAGIDQKSGPNQDEPGSDGIGDTPYTIDENNIDRYPLMEPAVVHDVAITNIIPSRTVVGQGFNFNINIQATNKGNRLETVNVTIYINSTPITQTLNLTLGTTNITFTINTTSWNKGNYTINAYASPVPEENNTEDNALTYNDTIIITVPGDTDGDADIDIYDIVRLASAYGSKIGEVRFKSNCDIDGNGEINIFDVVIATSRYGYKEQ